MNLSLIINVNDFSPAFEKTLNSIIANKNSNFSFELLIISDTDHQNQIKLINYLSKIFFNVNFPLKIITNFRNQGFSYNINNAIKNAKGKYLIFLEEGQVITDNSIANFCSLVKKFENNNKSIDIIEFSLFYQNHNIYSSQRIIANTVISVKEDKQIFAKINSLIFTKAFNREFLINNNIYFLNYVRYDTMFIYQVLTKAENFLCINLVFSNYEFQQLKYSVYDLLKQWVHIFNNYRLLNLYHILEQELDYAFLRYCLVNFLDLVRLQNSKVLASKAIAIVEQKINRRLKKSKNNYYQLAKLDNDITFINITANIPEYINIWKSLYCK